MKMPFYRQKILFSNIRIYTFYFLFFVVDSDSVELIVYWYVWQATLIFLMDHLALVVSASDRNKMSAQNLAIAMGPPLILHSGQDTPSSGHAPINAHLGLDYEQPIGILKYLLQIWPAPKSGNVAPSPMPPNHVLVRTFGVCLSVYLSLCLHSQTRHDMNLFCKVM